MENMIKLQFSSIQDRPDLKSFSPALAMEHIRRDKRFVSFGIDNDFPQYLLDIKNNNAILNSLINAAQDYTYGSEMIINSGNYLNKINSENENLDDTIKFVIDDLWVFGGCAIQLKFNVLGQIIEIMHTPFSIIRISPDEKTAYILEDVKNLKYVPKDIPSLSIYDPKEFVTDDIRLVYYKNDSKTSIYPKPDYFSALSSCELLIKICHYRLAEIDNNFSASTLIKLKTNRIKDAQYMHDVATSFRETFSGSGTAGRFAVLGLSDDESIEIDKLSPDNLDSRYTTIYEQARNDLFCSFHCNPIIAGLPVSSGFQDQNFFDAATLFNRLRILPKQKVVENLFNSILGADFLKIIPLTFENYEKK